MNCSLIATLTFLVGLLAGHRFNLYRDRRKEFNEVARPLKVAFKYPMPDGSASFSRDDWLVFLHLVGLRKRSACKKAMDAYDTECANVTRDSYGQQHFAQPEKVRSAVARLDALCQFM